MDYKELGLGVYGDTKFEDKREEGRRVEESANCQLGTHIADLKRMGP